MKKKVPYNTQVQFAILAGKSDEAHDVIGRALAEMGNGALEFAQSYPFDDFDDKFYELDAITDLLTSYAREHISEF